MKKVSTKRKEGKKFQVIHPRAAGIDIGSMLHYVAVPPQLADEPVKKFGSFTSDLKEIAKWLKSIGVNTVAMESTGNYWFPLYDLLQSEGFEVYLVNARYLKNVSGRKTDVSDCQWIQKLHTFGLVPASFIPEEEIRKLRCYVRQRNNIEIDKAKDLQYIQRSLTNMNIKLQHLVSDIEGVTAMKIVQDIACGINDPKKLAEHANYKGLKASKEEIEKSLEGNFTEEHLFTLNQALESYNFHRQQMRKCEEKMELLLKKMSPFQEDDKIFRSITKKKRPRKNEYNFDVSSYLRELLGVDATKVEGLKENTILEIVSETGTDLKKWRTEKHFTSWLKLCPNPAISGGKFLGNRGNKTSSRAAKAFRLAARSLHSSKSYLGALYRKLSARKGSSTAIKAVARKLAVIFYKMVTNKIEYIKTEMETYNEKYKHRLIKHLEKSAQNMGYELIKIDHASA